MKKDIENKEKSGFQFLTKKRDQVEETPPAMENEELSEPEEEEAEEASETEGEESDEAPEAEEVDDGSETEEESVEEEEAPAWLDVVLEGSSSEVPDGIRKVSDKDLLKIKGVGKGTLKQIREIYPYQEPRRSGKVMIRVLPMRGIGGVGKAGTEAEMDWEQAEEYVRDGYVEILE